MEMESPKGKNYGAEFMLKEFERLHNHAMATISRSEQRVNFFLTVSSASVGVLVFLSRQNTNLPSDAFSIIAVGVLVILLGYGITTLNRVISGAVQRADYYYPLLTQVQTYFAQHDPQVEIYLKKRLETSEKPKQRFKLISGILQRLRGTLTDFMVLSNSLICGGIMIALLAATEYQAGIIALWALLVTMLSMLLFYSYYRYLRKNLPLSKSI